MKKRLAVYLALSMATSLVGMALTLSVRMFQANVEIEAKPWLANGFNFGNPITVSISDLRLNPSAYDRQVVCVKVVHHANGLHNAFHDPDDLAWFSQGEVFPQLVHKGWFDFAKGERQMMDLVISLPGPSIWSNNLVADELLVGYCITERHRNCTEIIA